ncbi:MAG TPA: heparinase II/III family protein [Xanthobacteraceae bacterium]|nr:heparinase II/III family protein [Xanthobacteraceae bacterium]
MARVSLAERAKLTALLFRVGLHKLAARLNGQPLLRWRYALGKSDRLIIAPQDLRTADATRAAEIYAGRFAFAGKVVICDGHSPFDIAPASDEWAVGVLSFGWLRHLRAADSGITRQNGRALIDEWISLQGSWHVIGWRPDILSRRIVAWLSHSPMLLNDADVQFYRRFIRSLTRQVRYLRGNFRATRDGAARLQALFALTFAALCLAGQGRHLRKTVRLLVAELDRQILPDGGHISRNADVLSDLLLDLLPLRQAFFSRNLSPPASLLRAINRMMPMLRFFRHGDGNFAHFNGMGATQPDLLATVLAYDDARGTPVANAPHSGYQRIDASEVVLLMDAGRPPPLAVSHEAHAGCLSFELSAKAQRIIVNCGVPTTSRETWRQVARATAAHSTVTVDDAPSCRFLEWTPLRRLLGGAPILAGPAELRLSRDDRGDAVLLQASHDGYAASNNVIHRRSLMLMRDGSRLEGEDSFEPARGEAFRAKDRDDFAVRFHLHPTVKANRLSDGHGVMLLMPDKQVWTFSAYDRPVEIEESVYLAGADGPRRTVQIVIYGRARDAAQVRWSFSHVAPSAPSERGARAHQPELPL